jgi:hypothetical protein
MAAALGPKTEYLMVASTVLPMAVELVVKLVCEMVSVRAASMALHSADMLEWPEAELSVVEKVSNLAATTVAGLAGNLEMQMVFESVDAMVAQKAV